VLVADGDTVHVPETASVPDQLPDAVHDVALAEDQVTVLLAPAAIEVGLAAIVTVGFGAVTATVTDLPGELPLVLLHTNV
jgi:hypothetical protein